MAKAVRKFDKRAFVSQMEAALQKRIKKTEALMQEALAESVKDGGDNLVANLEDAYTKTGIARAQSGGLPGRHKSGEMVGAVSDNGENPEQMGNRTIAKFGWFAGQYQKYFAAQDLGAGQIPAANAMAGAQVYARERFRARTERIVKR